MWNKASFICKRTDSHVHAQTDVPVGATKLFCPHVVHRGLALQLGYKIQIRHDRLTHRHTSIKAGCNRTMHKNTTLKKHCQLSHQHSAFTSPAGFIAGSEEPTTLIASNSLIASSSKTNVLILMNCDPGKLSSAQDTYCGLQDQSKANTWIQTSDGGQWCSLLWRVIPWDYLLSCNQPMSNPHFLPLPSWPMA